MNIACFESKYRLYVILFCAIVLHYLLYQEAIKTLLIFFILSNKDRLCMHRDSSDKDVVTASPVYYGNQILVGRHLCTEKAPLAPICY